MNTILLTGEPGLMDAPLTYLILAITIYTSYRMMENHYERDKFLFNPYTIKRNKEWYRFFSHGLIHANWMHLLFNAYVLYAFGAMVEMAFKLYVFGELLGPIMYLCLYVSGLLMSSMYSYYKHQDNPGYNALGASGAVSSIVFTYILLAPTSGMGLIFIPGIYFPAIILVLLILLIRHI